MKTITSHILFAILLSYITCFSQQINIAKIEPSNWWAGMKYNKIQLMVYGNNLDKISAKFNNPLIKVNKVHNAGNADYAFIDIEIPDKIKPGNYILTISKNDNKIDHIFPILERKKPAGRYQGFNNKDVLYLITPDRFADGDTLNNNVFGMVDGYNPSSPLGRHGGDIQGIIDHLDYFKDLGITAIWINPLVENNTQISYHGYAVTDLYKIDMRFGTNDLYTKLVEEAHKRGLKIILDHVSNHIGINHPWMNDLPMQNWIHGSKENHIITPHYGRAVYDVHSDSIAIKVTKDGWFVDEMPDLNQSNPFVAKYLIQNTLWWIESSGLDGIREDTYYYSDSKFLADWAKTIFTEYPKFNVVGEVWIGESAFLAPFQANSKLSSFNTYLPSVTDFAFRDAAAGVISQDKSIFGIYETLAKDFLYSNPDKLVTFIDNHDIERVMYLVKDDLRKFKIALGLLLTTRGIPQIYYGTEIGMKGGSDHGTIRQDFPGGFKSSTHNAFNDSTRTQTEKEIYSFTKNLINLHKSSSALASGKLIHFPPVNETYYYFRISGSDTVLTVINFNNDKKTIDLGLAKKYLDGIDKATDLLSGTEKEIKEDKIEAEPYSVGIYRIR